MYAIRSYYAISVSSTSYLWDTYISEDHPTTNFQSADGFLIGERLNGKDYRSLIKPFLNSFFNGKIVVVTDAYFKTYRTISSTNETTMAMYKVTKAWTEGGVTWSSNITLGSQYSA